MNLLGYDASAPPDPAMMHSTGYRFALRYLTGPNGLTRAEVNQLHEAGLAVGAIFERDADEAEHPERGTRDGNDANELAAALELPRDVPIIFTDDNNDRDPAQEVDYFGNVDDACEWPVADYGNRTVIEAVHAAHPAIRWAWGVGTWGFGESTDGILPDDIADGPAQLIQLANTKAPVPAGPASYDTCVMVSPYPLWEANPMFTEDDKKFMLGLHAELGRWMQEQRALGVNVLIGEHNPATTNVLGIWMKQQTGQVLDAIKNGVAAKVDTTELATELIKLLGPTFATQVARTVISLEAHALSTVT